MPCQSSKFGASGFSGGIAAEEAVGHELEQPLEAQVVAQHLGERAARLLGPLVRGAWHALGDREARRHPADDDLLHRLLGRGAQPGRPAEAAEGHGEGEERS